MISQNPQISVIVPVYRNAETLCELYAQLHRVLTTEHLTFEVIFVDDACPDNSLAVLKTLAQKNRQVAVLVLENNVGQHQAVLTGLAQARGQWSVILDADLQDPPEAIPALLTKGREGFAAVFAGRRGKYESFFRLLTSRLFKWLLHLFSGVPPDAGIFVAFNRQVLESILEMPGSRPFVVAMIGCSGLPMASIPVARKQRLIGHSAYNFRGRLKSAWRGIVWALSWKWRTFLIAIYPGYRHAKKNKKSSPTPVKIAQYIGGQFDP